MVVRTTTTATWWVLGLGFWVQGFRCFPWLAVNFFLKDGLQVDSSTLQLLQNSANLPMVGKPLYGLVSDAVYISGQHRLPYLALGGVHLSERSFICTSLNTSCTAECKVIYDNYSNIVFKAQHLYMNTCLSSADKMNKRRPIEGVI